MSGPLVSLRAIDKSFANGTIALRGLKLDVREGNSWPARPSGCGKSTALRLIAGLMQPSGRRGGLARRGAS